jgi:Uma2 family endonuclease
LKKNIKMVESNVKKITVKEFHEMEFPETDHFIYELINGELMRKQAPQPLHQQISRRISAAFEVFLAEQPIGDFFYAPIDVFFDDFNNTQPDLLFIKNDRSFIIDLHNGIMGAPDLIVEIISPSSIKIDRFDKKEMYKVFAVKEYWLIDPKNQTAEIYVFEGDDYKLHQFLETEGKVKSIVLSGLDMDIATMFL